MKTGVLGGTFDPIHTGHLILAEEAYDAAGLDRVLLVPSGCSYFKEDRKVTDAKTRYEMTKAAAEGTDHFEVTDIETKRPGNSYTVETLRQLKSSLPGDDLYLIVGADTLLMMHLWKEPEEIFRLSNILVASRGDEAPQRELDAEIERLGKKYGAQIQKLPVRNIEISSTEIRERVGKGRSIHFLVPDSVERFIAARGLYREK